MAQPATSPKIEELRFRLKTDPKSRLFYQLAEELRRAGQFAESEQVLRSGLSAYPTYLAAWVSLGRVLRDLKNEHGAIEALNKAMVLDPGNVVAARLLADAYRALGDNLEAIKKYKLVHALMPGDEELKATIDQLDRDLHPPALSAEVSVEPVVEMQSQPAPDPVVGIEPAAVPEPAPEPETVSGEAAAPPLPAMEESPFDKTVPPFAESTGDAERMLAAHEESPFEEPLQTSTESSFIVEALSGMHIESIPEEDFATDDDGNVDDVFERAGSEPALAEDVTDTSTMADLYARQGLLNEARHIYEHILAREPGNAEIRGKLEAITPRVNPKIEKLERWLGKVSGKEVGRV
ncbi:MAG: tetratricopeptide repeat protein [Acidobacteriota bacterium]